MKRFLSIACSLSALIFPGQAARAQTVERAALVTFTAQVVEVDADKRELVLKGPLGNVVALKVDERVKRLGEVKPGDEVTADYFVSIAAEVREPTAEEKKTPLVIVDAEAKAPLSEAPAGVKLNVFKVVTTVEGLDRPTRSLTVKGPRGRTLTTRVKDVANLEKLRLGQTIVVTYSEAVAVSLEPRKKSEQ